MSQLALEATRVQVDRWAEGRTEAFVDHVAEEVPVALVYNGISHAVMLASPSNLEDFGAGFSLTEGIVDHLGEIYEYSVEQEDAGMTVQMRVAGDKMMRLKERKRSMAGRTGCGLCGAESLQHAIRTPQPVPNGHTLTAAALHNAFDQLRPRQLLQLQTGATHAAAWLAANGEVSIVREDIGRHNAVDKLIGALLRSGEDVSAGAVIVTSRASYEILQKVAAAGIQALAAISAPTGLAIRMAEDANITLLGFVREGRHVAYSHPQRLV
jgi:FdhD protein